MKYVDATLVLAPFSLPLVAVLYPSPLNTFIALAVLAAAILYLRGSKTDVLFFIGTGISGTVAEAIGIYAGAWTYTGDIIGGVPYWLPILWGIASMFVLSLHEIVLDFAEFYRNYR